MLCEGKVVCNFLELGQFRSPNSKGVSKGCAWGLFGGEHCLKVVCSARAVQRFPLSMDKSGKQYLKDEARAETEKQKRHEKKARKKAKRHARKAAGRKSRHSSESSSNNSTTSSSDESSDSSDNSSESTPRRRSGGRRVGAVSSGAPEFKIINAKRHFSNLRRGNGWTVVHLLASRVKSVPGEQVPRLNAALLSMLQGAKQATDPKGVAESGVLEGLETLSQVGLSQSNTESYYLEDEDNCQADP